MVANDLQIRLLGGFQLTLDSRPLTISESAARLLALLAISEQPRSRASIAGELWPLASEARALANLRTAVWRLTPPARACLVTTASWLSIAECVEVDLRAATAVVRELIDGELPCHPRRDQVDLLSQTLLPEWDDDWLQFERERTRQLHVHALERLGWSCLELGDVLTSVDIGTTVVGMEPLRESGHLLLITACLASGNRADARRCFERYRSVLKHELGLEPAVDWAELAGTTPHDPRPASSR